MLVATNATDVRTLVQLRDSAGQPITGMTHDAAGLSVYYRRPQDAVWVAIALQVGGVAWVSGGWREYGDGVYQLCLPNVVMVPNESTAILVVNGVNPRVVDVIDARLSPGQSEGPRTMTLTFENSDGDVVRNVIVEITGAERQVSDSLGAARFAMSPGTFEVKIFPPYGYVIPAPISIGVGGLDVDQTITLADVSVPASTNPNACQCRLTILTAHNEPIDGAVLDAVTANSVNFSGDALIFPTSAQTVSQNGLAIIYLIQGVTYNATVSHKGRRISFVIEVPNQSQVSIPTIVI